MARHLAVASSAQPARYEPPLHSERRRAGFLGRLLSSIRRHWRLFTGVLSACVVLVTIGTLLVPKQYTATVKMIVGSAQNTEQKNSTSPTNGSPELQSAGLSADTFADLIQDGPVVDKVIDTLKLGQSRAALLGRIAVKAEPNTSIISLSATWGNPTQAAAIANTFASVFTDRDKDLVSSRAVAAEANLQSAVSNAQNALEQANGALSTYQAGSKLEELQDDEKQAQAQLSSTQAQIATTPATIAGQQATDVNPASTELRQQLAETEMQLATARQRYTAKYPALIALEQQRDELQHQIAAEPATVAGQVIAVPNPVYQQLSQQAITLRSQIQRDDVQIAQQEQQSKALGAASAAPAQTTQLGLLQERAQQASDTYKALEQKYNDAVVAANSAVSDVSIVQPADSNNVSVRPNLVLNIVASIVAGLILALLAVAIANAIRRRIREESDVERMLGLPVIAHIPSMTTDDQRALPWLQTVTLEAFLHLCASLRILGRKCESHVIVITSPEKGDGKTTIAYHLASAMSRIRPHVLLIDADMRCPALHLQANVTNGLGLSDILSGQRSFDQVVVHYTATLDVLTAGTLAPNPLELAQAASLDDLLDLARERYDCVIIDTPALTHVVDPVLIAARADSTALVLSANNSHEGAAAQAAARLRSLGIDNILGVIMNRIKTKFADYGDYLASGQPSLKSIY
jgi:polysaccharide biosynthesis transport protein